MRKCRGRRASESRKVPLHTFSHWCVLTTTETRTTFRSRTPSSKHVTQKIQRWRNYCRTPECRLCKERGIDPKRCLKTSVTYHALDLGQGDHLKSRHGTCVDNTTHEAGHARHIRLHDGNRVTVAAVCSPRSISGIF